MEADAAGRAQLFIERLTNQGMGKAIAATCRRDSAIIERPPLPLTPRAAARLSGGTQHRPGGFERCHIHLAAHHGRQGQYLLTLRRERLQAPLDRRPHPCGIAMADWGLRMAA